MITIASTSFVILFGVISLYPVMIKLFEIKPDDIQKRIKLIRIFEYRFLKRLYKGWTLRVLLISAVLFLLSNLTSLYYFYSGRNIILTFNAILVSLSIIFIISTIVVSLIQAIGPTDKEWNLILEYGESGGGVYRDEDTENGDSV